MPSSSDLSIDSNASTPLPEHILANDGVSAQMADSNESSHATGFGDEVVIPMMMTATSAFDDAHDGTSNRIVAATDTAIAAQARNGGNDESTLHPEPARGDAPHKVSSENRNVYIAHLPSFNFADADLRRLVMPFGRVISARIMRAKGTGAGKGYAFVLFADESSAALCIEALHGKSIDGVGVLEVRLAHRDASQQLRVSTVMRRASHVQQQHQQQQQRHQYELPTPTAQQQQQQQPQRHHAVVMSDGTPSERSLADSMSSAHVGPTQHSPMQGPPVLLSHTNSGSFEHGGSIEGTRLRSPQLPPPPLPHQQPPPTLIVNSNPHAQLGAPMMMMMMAPPAQQYVYVPQMMPPQLQMLPQPPMSQPQFVTVVAPHHHHQHHVVFQQPQMMPLQPLMPVSNVDHAAPTHVALQPPTWPPY